MHSFVTCKVVSSNWATLQQLLTILLKSIGNTNTNIFAVLHNQYQYFAVCTFTLMKQNDHNTTVDSCVQRKIKAQIKYILTAT